KKKEERKNLRHVLTSFTDIDYSSLRLSQLVETISKKPIPPHVKALTLEMCVNDRNDEEVEVPYVRLVIRK
ncbi:6580_t:CDS:2, partial [Racocetra persica]